MNDPQDLVVEIETVDPSSADARWCLARYFEELGERFESGFDPEESIVVDHSELTPPRGAFLVARVEGRSVACGAVKRVSPEVGYIKRMWVDGGFRGLGLGRRMLAALEKATRDLGCSVAQLETNRALKEAIRLYRTSGYVEVEAFNDEPYAHHWFEKRLDGVARLQVGDAPQVVDVLSEAFHDYPVMRFVVGEAGDDYGRRLKRLVGFFVMARALRGEPLLGVDRGGELAAAAIVSFPDGTESPPALASLREEVWAELGADARARYDACGDAWRPLGVTAPHIHLNMIGVRAAFQGQGYARRIMDHVHRMSRERADSEGVSLTTEDPRNVPLYRGMGYEVVGHAQVAPGLQTWGFFRRD